ncbi:MAG TPA: MAPEG family protein [Stenotrophomonas sp.]|nr:MAPEG family protein [Stenotrophomonas sp.]
MSIEMRMLAWAIVLGFVQLLLAAGAMTAQRGAKWNASARDGTPPPLVGVAGRLDRAFRNFLETFAFFAAAVLAVVLAQRTDAHTALGAQVYFWARVLYIPLYAAGIPYVRSLVWTISMIGIVLVLWPLLH